jgi:hypothetical protein
MVFLQKDPCGNHGLAETELGYLIPDVIFSSQDMQELETVKFFSNSWQYNSILSSRHEHSLLAWLTMSSEYPRTFSQRMLSAVVILRPWSNASYSAALLDVRKCICRTFEIFSLRRCYQNSTPAPWSCREPSKLMVQYSISLSLGGSWATVHSATKSLRAWALIAVLGL